MSQVGREELPNEESVLLDYVERLSRFRTGRRAVHIHLARLKPFNRRQHHLRVAASTFEMLIRSYEGALFRMFNSDIVVICKGATVAKIDEYVLRLRYLFSEDPLMNGAEGEADKFCSWYDVEQDYDALLNLARELVSARTEFDTAQAAAGADPEHPQVLPSRPLDPSHLTTVDSAIAQADLSAMLCRQAICAVAKGAKPQPLFHEIYISIEALRQTLLPDVDLKANRWLFQDLTRRLDQRMIAMLMKNDDHFLGKSFSINLTIDTLLAPEFLEFDKALKEATRKTIIIELQLIDVFADFASFVFARDFVRSRGYRLCLDGTTHLSLPLVDREQLGFDLVKLQWNSELGDIVHDARGERLRETVKRQAAERIILCHSDSETAIEVGRWLGLAMFQGHYLDDLLSAGASTEETARALSAANARHRAAARLTADA